MSDAGCPECGFKLWLPIADLEVSSLGLYDDARFPGRCILVFHQHVEHFDELGVEDACAYTEDGRRVGRAIAQVVGASRINYAILGNTQPHLHMHLIPRQLEEPKPSRTPWEHPGAPRPLAPDQASGIVEDLRRALR